MTDMSADSLKSFLLFQKIDELLSGFWKQEI